MNVACTTVQRLETMTTEDYYPLEENEWVCQTLTVYSCSDLSPYRSEVKVQTSTVHESAKLPLAIRERDIEYQFHRVIVFSRLLEGYPYSRGRVLEEALLDVCPLYRGEIWAAMLGIKV